MKTSIFTRPAVSTTHDVKGRCRRLVLRSAVGAGAVAVLGVGLAGTAFAATSPGTTDANVAVGSAISLTGLPTSFLLSGLPGGTVSANGDVTFTVATNNNSGYAVTVQSSTPTMVGTGTNPDSILIGALGVRETGGTTFTAMSDTAAVTVHSQDTRSAEGGDALSNDYQVVIPFVNSDTYTATLNYVATTL